MIGYNISLEIFRSKTTRPICYTNSSPCLSCCSSSKDQVIKIWAPVRIKGQVNSKNDIVSEFK